MSFRRRGRLRNDSDKNTIFVYLKNFSYSFSPRISNRPSPPLWVYVVPVESHRPGRPSKSPLVGSVRGDNYYWDRSAELTRANAKRIAFDTENARRAVFGLI